MLQSHRVKSMSEKEFHQGNRDISIKTEGEILQDNSSPNVCTPNRERQKCSKSDGTEQDTRVRGPPGAQAVTWTRGQSQARKGREECHHLASQDGVTAPSAARSEV